MQFVDKGYPCKRLLSVYGIICVLFMFSIYLIAL